MTKKPLARRMDIEQFLRLIAVEGCNFEVRAVLCEHLRTETHKADVKIYPHTAIERAVADIMRQDASERYEGIYATLNPIEAGKQRGSASDKDITRYRWLPLDFDPVRPHDKQATPEQTESALTMQQAVKAALTRREWPDPIEGRSGNGAHLLYRVDLPNTPKGKTLVKDAIEALDRAFSTPQVKIDTSVSNPARIWRLYGTHNRKGSPARLSGLIEYPESLIEVSPDQLEELIATYPPRKSSAHTGLNGTGKNGTGKNGAGKNGTGKIPAGLLDKTTDDLTVDSLIETARTAPVGERDNTTHKVAYTIGGMIEAGRVEIEDIPARIEAAALANGMTPTEARKFATRSLAEGQARPLHKTPHTWSKQVDPNAQEHLGNPDDGLPALDVANLPAIRPLDPKFVETCLNDKEVGDSTMLVTLFGDRLRYDHAGKAWYLWGGNAWEQDKTNAVRLLIRVVAAQYLHFAAELQGRAKELTAQIGNDETEDLAGGDDNDQVTEIKREVSRLSKLWKSAISRRQALYTLARKKSVIEGAQEFREVALVGDEWDQKPWLLACPNGVIDLQTGQFRPGLPSDLQRLKIPTTWRGIDAHAPRFERFLTEIFPDPALPAFIQRLFGYSITGIVKEHVFSIFWGKGRNGKDTLFRLLGYVLGDVASTMAQDVLIDQRSRTAGSASPHLAELQGKRLVWASENTEGAKLNAAQVKLITGGGRINARAMYKDPVSFEPTHKAFLLTNYKPQAQGNDYALWKRILLIPFVVSFVENPTEANERKADPKVENELQTEAAGVLAWLVRGCLEWQNQGLNPPASVRAATQEYQESEDELGAFIDERCEVGPNLSCTSRMLFKAWELWAKDNNLSVGNEKTFAARMKAKNYTKNRKKTGMQYDGIDLAEATKREVQGSVQIPL